MGIKQEIVIVEDEASHRLLMEKVFTSMGFAVYGAANTDEGFRKILERRPQLIVTDIQLPDRNGFDLCLRVRQHPELRHIPILVVSGVYSGSSDRLRAQASGAQAYLAKPFRILELLETARLLLQRPPN